MIPHTENTPTCGQPLHVVREDFWWLFIAISTDEVSTVKTMSYLVSTLYRGGVPCQSDS